MRIVNNILSALGIKSKRFVVEQLFLGTGEHVGDKVNVKFLGDTQAYTYQVIYINSRRVELVCNVVPPFNSKPSLGRTERRIVPAEPYLEQIKRLRPTPAALNKDTEVTQHA